MMEEEDIEGESGEEEMEEEIKNENKITIKNEPGESNLVVKIRFDGESANIEGKNGSY
jgi:hypothetical protein